MSFVDVSRQKGIKLAEKREFVEFARNQIGDSLAVKRRLLDDTSLLQCFEQVAQATIRSLQAGGKVILFGNGGSAADAQHIAAELAGRYKVERPGIAAITVTVNTSALTAIANDYGYDDVYARQVQGLGAPGDVAIGISTSGNSMSVVRGLETARAKGLITVAMTGGSGGRLRSYADFCLQVPSDQTPRIQECHILLGHILCDFVETALFGTPAALLPQL